jgi:hypothetical protein
MTILDITGCSMMIHMPAVPAGAMAMQKKKPKPHAKTPVKQMRLSAADYAHTYCLSNDSTLKTSVPLLSGDGSKANYKMMIKTPGSKPTPDEKSNFYLKRKSIDDLSIDPAQVVVTISIPFPKSVLPLRYAYHEDGTPVMGGKTCDDYVEHPLKIPLVYGFIYDLASGENPSLERSDGTILWQKPGANHVHVHAQPAEPDGSDHIQYLAGAFTPKAIFYLLRPPPIVSECAPAGGALETPAAELYGLPRLGADACIKPSVVGNEVVNQVDPDPGNCVSMFLDS